jgi:hypothetical protein
MKTAAFKQALRWIIMGSLLLAAACAEGEVQTYRPSSYPAYRTPYYPDYYGPSYYPDQDPQFWQMWQDRQGGP